MAQYKWAERSVGQQGKVNEKEEPVKFHDHAMDALRYLIMTMPEPTPKKVDPLANLKYGSVERALHQELANLRNPPKGGDPFGG